MLNAYEVEFLEKGKKPGKEIIACFDSEEEIKEGDIITGLFPGENGEDIRKTGTVIKVKVITPILNIYYQVALTAKNADETPTLSTHEVNETYGIPFSTIKDMIKTGRLNSTKVNGRWHINVDDLLFSVVAARKTNES